MEKNKLREIEENILTNERPSIYLEEIKKTLINTPLEALVNLEKIEQNKKYHPEGAYTALHFSNPTPGW